MTKRSIILAATACAENLEPPSPFLAIRADEFHGWFDQAEPGRRIEYHRGHLVIDRARGFSPFGEKLRREINAIADHALALAEDDRLLLVQQRHGHGDYSYFAIKATRQPKGTSASSESRDRGGR